MEEAPRAAARRLLGEEREQRHAKSKYGQRESASDTTLARAPQHQGHRDCGQLARRRRGSNGGGPIRIQQGRASDTRFPARRGRYTRRTRHGAEIRTRLETIAGRLARRPGPGRWRTAARSGTPGAALDDKSCALELHIDESPARAARCSNEATGEAGWLYRGWLITPLRDSAGFAARRPKATQPTGQVLVTPHRIERRRNDAWRTLPRWIARDADTRTLATEDEQAQTATAAALTCAGHWPVGPAPVHCFGEQR